MTRSILHLMRHGEVSNPDAILYGRRPGFGITERGWQMARCVADELEAGGHDLRAVVASPLLRAQQSATPTAQRFGLPVLTDGDLIEAGNAFEGVAVNRHRWVLAEPRHWAKYVNPLRPSWGEPYADQVERMSRAIRRTLGLLGDGGEALLVSHQLPIWVTRLSVEGRPLAHDPRRRQCALASLTSLEFEGRTLVALTYWEPAAEIVRSASDMVPGASGAALHGSHPAGGAA